MNAAGTAVAFGQNPINFAEMTDFQFQHSSVSLFYRDNKQATVDHALETAHKVVEQLGTEHNDIRIRLASGTIALQEAMNRVVKRYHCLLVGESFDRSMFADADDEEELSRSAVAGK